MKKALKIILIIFGALVALFAILILTVAILSNGITIKHTGMKYADKYRNTDYGDEVYFTEDDFGDYDTITYKVKDKKGFFESVGSMFVVTYTDEQYAKQLEVVNGMEFLDEDYMQGLRSDQDAEGFEAYSIVPEIIPAAQVDSDGWLIRILKNGDENNYPKEIAMVGTNDAEKTIVYMYFTDSDIDYISEEAGEDALKEFIEKYFSFKF